MKQLASDIADLVVGASAARTSGQVATADDLDRRLTETIQEANLRGDITNIDALHKELTNQVIARHAPRLSDALGLHQVLKNK